ncbi:hypothetical protein ABG768_006097 [Culter alburnus]|uniref:Uncharacterized protein n=1 Tax=Culter alburnus TaxID=194366 RepID=A0AAW1ZQE4_CULAL
MLGVPAGPVVTMLQLSSRLDPASPRHAALNPPAVDVSSPMQSLKCRGKSLVQSERWPRSWAKSRLP